MVYASLGRRLAAWLLDSAILLLALFAVFISLKLIRSVGLWTPSGTGATVTPEEAWEALGVGAKLLVVMAFVVSLGPFYFVLFEASPRQATFGKQILNIYVTRDDGKQISIARAVGRWTAKFTLSWFGLSLVSVVTIAALKERKALHDFVANTLVLCGHPEPKCVFEPWRIAVALGVPIAWLVGTFLATI
jgi:uncharacterized RDD family membrane protein YckC